MAISLDSPPEFCQFFGFPPPGEGDSLALWTPPQKNFPNLSPPTDLGARPCMITAFSEVSLKKKDSEDWLHKRVCDCEIIDYLPKSRIKR